MPLPLASLAFSKLFLHQGQAVTSASAPVALASADSLTGGPGGEFGTDLTATTAGTAAPGVFPYPFHFHDPRTSSLNNVTGRFVNTMRAVVPGSSWLPGVYLVEDFLFLAFPGDIRFALPAQVAGVMIGYGHIQLPGKFQFAFFDKPVQVFGNVQNFDIKTEFRIKPL